MKSKYDGWNYGNPLGKGLVHRAFIHRGRPHAGPDIIKNEKKKYRPHPMWDLCKGFVRAGPVRHARSNPLNVFSILNLIFKIKLVINTVKIRIDSNVLSIPYAKLLFGRHCVQILIRNPAVPQSCGLNCCSHYWLLLMNQLDWRKYHCAPYIFHSIYLSEAFLAFQNRKIRCFLVCQDGAGSSSLFITVGFCIKIWKEWWAHIFLQSHFLLEEQTMIYMQHI